MSGGRSRVIVVLGYSNGGRDKLHPIAAARLRHAAEISTEHDVVVLSGWARVPGTRPEAALMAEAWAGTAREVVVDPDARTTVGNAINALDDVRRVAPAQVLVVTSGWHAPRAKVIFVWQLRSNPVEVVTSSPLEPRNIRALIHEIPRWAILPVQLLNAAITRRGGAPSRAA